MKGFMNQSTVEINVELTYNFVHNDQRMNIVITVDYGMIMVALQPLKNLKFPSTQ